MVKLKFSGGKEMARSLRSLPGFVATRLLEKSVGAGAAVLIRAAKAKAPRPADRRRPRTKRLSDSINARVIEKDRSHVVLHVGPRQNYAHLVERGHVIIARGPSRKQVSITTVRISKRTGRQVVSTRLGLDPADRVSLRARRAKGPQGVVAPRPFMEPALFETREKIIQVEAATLAQGIEQEMQRLGRARVA